MSGKPRVVVVADWDADGVVSAAIIKFVQERLQLFPVKGGASLEFIPSGPRGLPDVLESIGCPDVLVILDIPLTVEVHEAIIKYRARCSGAIYYFDHHHSTISNLSELERLGVKAVVGRSATSVLVRMFVEGLGARLTPRLNQFSDAVAVLEGRRKMLMKTVSEQIVKMAASISRALNVSKDASLWRSYIDWLSNPLPFEAPRLPEGLNGDTPLEIGLKLSREAEEDVKRAAMELSMQAVRVGFMKFVDARGKWKSRGASALAGEISRITGQPVALLIQRDDGALLLVIRGHRGLPQLLAEMLVKEGIAVDKGGHKNLATCRLKEGVRVQDLIDALRKLSLEAWRKLESKNKH